MRKIFRPFPVILLIVTLLLGIPVIASPTKADSLPASRPFHLSFTPFPYDATLGAVQKTYAFIGDHGDMITHQLLGGVPWNEALNNEPYSNNLMDDWTFREEHTPVGHKIFVAVTPLNIERTGLEDYWGEGPGMPLTEPWVSYPLNHPDVKTAYLNYIKKVIVFFQPDYLAIGVEVNTLLGKNPTQWPEYLELNEYVYQGLKSENPDLPIFATIQVDVLQGMVEETRGGKDEQYAGVTNLLNSSDYVALSSYPYLSDFFEDLPPSSHYDVDALDPTGDKPQAIAEMGYISEDMTLGDVTWHSDGVKQEAFINMILENGVAKNYEFITNFFPIDYDPFLSRITDPYAYLIYSLFVHTGLARPVAKPKLSLNTWDSYLALPRASSPTPTLTVTPTPTPTTAPTQTPTPTPAETIEFYDSFEDGTLNKWIQDPQNDWFNSTQRATDGFHSVEVDGNASNATLSLANAIDLTGKVNATLTFPWLIERHLDGGEYLCLDLYDGSWQEYKCLRGNDDPEDVWHNENINLSNYLVANFKIRFRAKMSHSKEDANIDNVKIVSIN